ncbi:MAG: FlgB family protein [Pseudomonadota bacterium]
MFENLDVFRMAHSMAKHAGARHTVIAQNMANADTPDYAAHDIEPFAEIYKGNTDQVHLKATRGSHMHGVHENQPFSKIDRKDAVSDPNGNSVSLETEMMHAVQTKRQHDRAMMIYKSALTILRAAVRR